MGIIRLTPQGTISRDGEANSTDLAGAPEVEVTPEMIAAGVEAIWDRLGGYDLGGHFSASRLAEEVYRAMASARHPASGGT
jgi:hypothetical protein